MRESMPFFRELGPPLFEEVRYLFLATTEGVADGSPAVGRAAADELLGREPGLDLSPYRLDRFAAEVTFPETLVL